MFQDSGLLRKKNLYNLSDKSTIWWLIKTQDKKIVKSKMFERQFETFMNQFFGDNQTRDDDFGFYSF